MRNNYSHLIDSVIKRYLINNVKNDNLALQINGAWGTGKTYYIKHNIINKMTHGYYNKEYQPIYLSLNGINSISQLRQKLTNSLLTSGTHSSKRIAYMTLSILSSGLGIAFNIDQKLSMLKKLGINPNSIKNTIKNIILNNKKDIVLIFDDLERCKLDLKTVFGFLSNIIDGFQCKTIIISNDNAFNHKEKKFFKMNKEKIIGKTVHFGINSEDIALNILSNNIKYNKLISKRWILNVSDTMMKHLKDINLRTIFSIISTYNDLCFELRNLQTKKHINDKLLKQSLMTGYLSIFTLTDLIKRDEIHPTLISLFGKRFQTIINNHNDNTSHSYLYQKFFKGSEVCFQNNIFYTNDIYKLVISDIFDPQNYINKIRDAFYSKKEIIYIAWSKLNNSCLSMSDKEVKQYETEIYNNLDIYKSSFIQITNVYSLFYLLKRIGLLLDKRISIPKLRKTLINKAMAVPINQIHWFSPATIGLSNSIHDYGLKSTLQNIYNKRYKNLLLYEGKEHLTRIFTGDYIDEKTSKNWFRKVSICQVILNNKNLQSILINGNDPSAIFNLINYIKRNSNNISFPNIHLTELSYINAFKKFLLHKINHNRSRVMYIDICHLLNIISKCKSYLSNIKKD